jgi:capsular exopolysaccharide synthesis family protein
MNRDLTVTTDERAWPLDSYDSSRGDFFEEPNGSVLDLPALLRIVRSWRWFILAAMATGLTLAIIYTLLTTPMYRADVTIQVNPPTVQILDDNTGQRSEGSLTSNSDDVATQIGLLRSSSLAERVAQDLNLGNNPAFVPQDGDPQARLKAASHKVFESLTVRPPEDGQLINFTFVSRSPALAAAVANGIADAFIQSNIERRFESSAYARNFLERQIRKTRGDLENSERSLVAYAQAEGIINTSSGSTADTHASDADSPQGESLLELNKALAAAIAQRVAAEGAYKAAASSGLTTTENQSSQPLRQSLAALQAQYAQKRTMMKPDHPDMVSLRSQIAELTRQIAHENASVESGRVNSLRADYQAAVAAESALRQRVADLKDQVLNLRGRSIRYAILQRDVDTNRTLYDALLQRYKQIGVGAEIGTAPVSIVDHAEVPAKPFKPDLFLNVIVGLGLGFLLGILTAVLLEYLNDTIKTREDVRNKLGLACLGIIPKRSARGQLVDDLQDPSSAISEAYSTIAASLRFSTESGDPDVLLLTSAGPGEGKSSSSLALAQNFARRGKSVLLIDCDLRKPTFNSPSDGIGLTKLLTNSDPVASHVVSTRFENLWLLPAGAIPPNPADLLSTPRFGAIVREAAANFQLIIIDAPPVIGLADAPLIASAVKEVMFIVESGKSRARLAREAVNKLKAAGAHVLGATITKSTEVSSTYGYGYGTGHGYKYAALEKNRMKITLSKIPDQDHP